MYPAASFQASDVTGQVVRSWVNDCLPPLHSLLTVETEVHDGVPVWKTSVQPARRAEVAWRCAVAHAAMRLRFWPRTFGHWFSQLAGLGPADMTEVARRHVVLLKNIGVPGDAGPDAHLCGLVAETILGELLETTPRGLGNPVMFEGHDFAVTDPGGDALLIFETDEGPLGFQLWESKAVTGATRTSKQVAKEASEQVVANGAEYLARYVTIAERTSTPPVARPFLLDLIDLWIDDDEAKHVGVSISRESSKCTTGAFSQIPAILDMPVAKTQGSYCATDVGLLAFSEEVRSHIWAGCDLP